MDPLRGSSVKFGTVQRGLAWPLRQDDTHKSRSVNKFMAQAQQLRQQADFSDNMMATLESIAQKIGLSSKTVEEASEKSSCRQPCCRPAALLVASFWSAIIWLEHLALIVGYRSVPTSLFSGFQKFPEGQRNRFIDALNSSSFSRGKIGRAHV